MNVFVTWRSKPVLLAKACPVDLLESFWLQPVRVLWVRSGKLRADDIGQCIRERDIDLYSSIDCNAPRSADPIVEGTFAMKIMLSGLLTWLTTPLLLYLSLFYSTCANGPAWWFYCVPFLTQACSLAVQFHIDQTIREAKFNATYLKELFSKPLAACLPPLRFSLSIMDHWVALTIFGVADSFDLFSDAIQIGQVYMWHWRPNFSWTVCGKLEVNSSTDEFGRPHSFSRLA